MKKPGVHGQEIGTDTARPIWTTSSPPVRILKPLNKKVNLYGFYDNFFLNSILGFKSRLCIQWGNIFWR